jgi:hypothetical protein
MQPAANPDDIHAILSRFQTWAEQQPANGNGNGHKNGASPLEGVREIPYEEAIRQHRNRRAAQGQRRTAPPRTSASPVPPREPDVQAEPEPVAEVPSPSAVERTVAKIAEVAATSKFEPASPLSNDAPHDPAPAAIGVLVEPVASVAKARSPRGKPVSSVPPEETEKLAPIPARTIATHAAVTAMPPLKPAVRRKPKTATALKAAAQSTLPRKSAAPLAAKPPIAKQPQFRQVLTKTVLQAERPAAPKPTPKKEATPDRTQRITTRFSPAEQRRIEKQAAESGLTVSAWLRHCALSNGAMPVHPKKPQAAPAKSGSRRRSVAAPNPAHVALFSQPTNSALGNWLTLLRQRFLSSPARFTEQA